MNQESLKTIPHYITNQKNYKTVRCHFFPHMVFFLIKDIYNLEETQ